MADEEDPNSVRVCVTGGSGYVASWLIQKLLHKGYTVHATLRCLGDEDKVKILKRLPGAETRLELYEADMYNPPTFEPAIRGCAFVFHVATPLQHVTDSQACNSILYTDTVEAAVEATKSIVRCCIKAGSVKKLIYTASVVAASPMKEDGSGFRDTMDESCWSPLNLSVPCCDQYLEAYKDSKILSEKEVLKYKEWTTETNRSTGMEVVSLVCGLIGGDSLLPYLPGSVCVLLGTTRFPNNYDYTFKNLRFIQEFVGKVPILHIEDACEAHVFCMENPSVCGRYLCASSYVQTSEIDEYIRTMYPEFHIKHEGMDGMKRDIRWDGTKLIEEGFAYKYDLKAILQDSIKTAMRFA